MTPRETLLQVLEAADDDLIADMLAWLAKRRFSLSETTSNPLTVQAQLVEASVSEPLVETGCAEQETSVSLDEDSSPSSSFVAFFRNSPLCDVADEIDLSRDQSPVPDRVFL